MKVYVKCENLIRGNLLLVKASKMSKIEKSSTLHCNLNTSIAHCLHSLRRDDFLATFQAILLLKQDYISPTIGVKKQLGTYLFFFDNQLKFDLKWR